MRTLVIDDEPFVLKLLARQLKNLGFEEVVLHECGHDALTMLENQAETIGLIFCDLQMPQMDGVEFVRHLVRIGYTGSLVLVSGEADRVLQSAEKLARAHQLRVLGVLHKPVSPEQLRQLLNGKRYSSTAAAGKSYGPDEIRRAIALGELENHYQPKVDLASGSIAGVEALVRWHHRRDGLVVPGQFIPAAEEHGLIDELTRAVLSAALRQARLWQDAGHHLHVAVNVSMDSLAALEFPDFVAREIDAAGVLASSLVLEITESRLMKDPLAALDILTRLRLKRIRLSIDDFGTGYSSLAQLRDVPFDELKVDRGFIHGASRDPSLKAIVEASLGMARQLGMKTVAEGVEDQADWEYLRSTGCDLAQGYFIAKPQTAVDLAGWMAAWERRRLRLEPSAP
jgi:EAL domain-containing protein (putative c-di-GMP-specific phosphodiesterase class I)/FixJ family two-component response regulator